MTDTPTPSPSLLQTTLQEVRARIDGEVLKSVKVAMLVSALGGTLLMLALSVMPNQNPVMQESRLSSAFALTAIAAMALLLSRLYGARISVMFFAGSLLTLCLGMALYLGTGVGSASTVVPAAMIALISFTIGPRVGLWWTRVAIAGVLLQLYLQLAGFIPGVSSGNVPPPVAYAVTNIIVFLVIGTLISRYSKVFWEAMNALDGARTNLQSQVDELQSTRAELQDSEQRLSTLLDHAPLAILIFDQDTGALRYANRHALHAHGVQSRRDLVEQALFSEGLYRSDVMLQAVRDTWLHGPRELQWRSRGAGDHELWWSIRLEVLSLDGQPHVVGFAHDITARLQAERALLEHRAHLAEQVRDRTTELMQQQRRLETIIEALPVSLTIKDPQGRYQLCNRLFERATRLSRSQLLGRRAEDVFPPAMAQQIRRDDDALFTGTPVVRYEVSHTRQDGTRIDHLVTKVALPDASGRPEAVLTLSVDISEQKALQRELSDAKTEAERLASIKSAFLANMSHEIRTPLHGMLGLAQMGLRQEAPAPVRQGFERIRHAGRHLLGVINDILDFSKIDAGKLSVERCALDPQAVAQEALTLVTQKARDKGLALKLKATGTLPAAVMGDPLRMRQILINLLSNGIKFTEQGSVTLHVSTEQGQLCLAVQDTGIGLHPDMQERVFSPFEQADGSTSRRFGGTGLGLSISRQLARLMGGDITVSSLLGKGSTFTLQLPLEVADARDVATSPCGSALHTENTHLHGLRILAADDVDINRDILLGLLSQQGAEVHCVEDGKQALNKVKEHGSGFYDIVLMDVQMPVMNGLQATELLHMRDATLPIVALTAHALPEERQRCVDAGMLDHLSKPFESDDLVRMVLRHSRRAPLGQSLSAPSPAPQTATAEIETAPSVPAHTEALALDLDGALRRCGNQPALLRTLITRFSREQADFCDRFEAAQHGDLERARQLAHRLKGTAGNLGLPGLATMAGDLEGACSAGHEPQVQAVLARLRVLMQQHQAALQAWLDQEPVLA